MTKGRRSAPSGANDGIWFQHKIHGNPDLKVQDRKIGTSTGNMLATPFATHNISHGLKPPEPFERNWDHTYKTTNRFSDHDNRNHFQDCGEYFGNGQDTRHLGRSLIPFHQRLHHTQVDFLKHNSRKPVDSDFHSTYGTSYHGKPTERPPTFRRFPKIYNSPNEGRIKLNTTTTDWFQPPDVPHKTPTQVMADAQQPYPTHNPWKYSYHGLRKIYPSYDRNEKPHINNIFNNYGHAFTTTS